MSIFHAKTIIIGICFISFTSNNSTTLNLWVRDSFSVSKRTAFFSPFNAGYCGVQHKLEPKIFHTRFIFKSKLKNRGEKGERNKSVLESQMQMVFVDASFQWKMPRIKTALMKFNRSIWATRPAIGINRFCKAIYFLHLPQNVSLTFGLYVWLWSYVWLPLSIHVSRRLIFYFKCRRIHLHRSTWSETARLFIFGVMRRIEWKCVVYIAKIVCSCSSLSRS